ncbi:Gfo/Idh/MocA family oxidoreductase [Marine Group I thaumarchaeote]|uniref:Gfo/Idh/MocA family oxidoreductase n=1 Tax=Marine Group I thaumarchaeote TaxID=2511932 RepID=A0A7K4NH35_9ARCH|nr:MAG: gfo/Idh/MocA family oxidoreductase [Nitrosopumilus sp. YT1]NMI81860.1 Gfo/Idh/MocA family oxidoreductase [Candidatus Nitrosopumilus sp. MTA1]NWJ28194.1 Gfo/Idh/MocA family oxidoreductase [Marine Group I thaumarchaeote]NWJ83567.1 Gfo/Idh/MocA family oxidoreductase [Marine Group I thaumarchaeote]NWK00637.1 Gfo/Idh/MocA family oxidoreductase [Marine Group I thaumarchaeote]
MKIVQIGVGGWGKNHTRILSQLGVLSAVCDTDSQRSKEYGEKYSVNHYESLDDLLISEKFDGAFVVTPTSTHTEIATKLLEAKKHVFVEKPMTYKSEDGEKLAKLAEKNKVILTCGYIERFNPAVDVVKKFVKEKKFGELVMLEFHRENRMPLHIKDVGIIYDTSVHDIDTANWLFDDMPHVVFARAGKIKHEHEDFASIMLGYKDDKVAIISSNWITPKKVRKFNAVCTDAIISSDFITQEIIVEKNDKTETVQNEKQEPLLLEIQSFLGTIDGKNEQVVKSQEAVNVTKIAEAALLSSQKGIPIYLDLK